MTDLRPVRPRAGLWLLALAIANGAAMRMVFSPVSENARRALHLSDTRLGLVQGVAASIPIALLAVPLGRLVDRGNRVRLLVALGLVWTLGSLATGLATGFLSLFLARMLAGLGAVLALPAAISAAADLSRPQARGRAMLLLGLGNVVGPAAGFACGGWLLGWFTTHPVGLAPWRAVQISFGLVSLVLLLPLLRLREPIRQEILAPATALCPAIAALWQRRRLLLPLFLGQISVIMADTAAGVWAAPVLVREDHLAPAAFSGPIGLAILVSGMLGALAGGYAADLGQRSGRPGAILTGAVLAAALAVPGGLFALVPNLAGFSLLLALLLLSGTATGLITTTALTVLVPNELRGICLGGFLVLGAIIGFGIAPSLVALGSDWLGGPTHLPVSLALTVSGTGLIAFLGFLQARLAARPRARTRLRTTA